MGNSNWHDALEDNYLALCTAILYPYGIGCEEAWKALNGNLEEPLIAAGILQDAIAILKDKKRNLERLRSVMGEEAYAKIIFVQQILLFYDEYEVERTKEEVYSVPCIRCKYSGTYQCWWEFVKFMGFHIKGRGSCQLGKRFKIGK